MQTAAETIYALVHPSHLFYELDQVLPLYKKSIPGTRYNGPRKKMDRSVREVKLHRCLHDNTIWREKTEGSDYTILVSDTFPGILALNKDKTLDT